MGAIDGVFPNPGPSCRGPLGFYEKRMVDKKTDRVRAAPMVAVWEGQPGSTGFGAFLPDSKDSLLCQVRISLFTESFLRLSPI
jgi:hypothetical protein